MTGTAADQVREAALRLIEAFGTHQRDQYFECFTPDATFIFYNAPDVLSSRAAYEAEWDTWERDDGFTVLECRSSDQVIRLVGEQAAIFTHAVVTRVSISGEEQATQERETIVFRRDADGRWLAVHEHLSPRP